MSVRTTQSVQGAATGQVKATACFRRKSVGGCVATDSARAKSAVSSRLPAHIAVRSSVAASSSEVELPSDIPIVNLSGHDCRAGAGGIRIDSRIEVPSLRVADDGPEITGKRPATPAIPKANSSCVVGASRSS